MDYIATLTETGLSLRVPALPATPAVAGEQVLCTTVRQVDAHVLAATYRQVDALAAELGIPEPRVQWFAPKSEAPPDATVYGAVARAGLMLEGDYGDFLTQPMPADGCLLGGLADTDPGDEFGPVILLLHTLRGDLLRMVVAHELRHLAQDASLARQEREQDAERFGMAYVAA